MGLTFWEKLRDVFPQVRSVVAVSETNPLPIKPGAPNDDDDRMPVQIENSYLPPVAGQTIKRQIQVPGVGTAAIYAAGEAFGTVIKLQGVFRPEKGSGALVGVVFHDLDDEGSQVDVEFFSQEVTTSADNAAFTPTDDENLLCIGVVSITEFFNWGSNQVGVLKNINLPLVSGSTDVWVRLVTQSTPTIAAGAVPWITFYIVPD